MAEQQATATTKGKTTSDGDGAVKEELQRRMEETRDSIAQTVTEIKDTVTDQYQSVKETVNTVTETLDWREQFRKHPGAWSLGALSVGYVIGNSLAAAIKGTKHQDQLLQQLAALGDHFTDELSKRGMSILAPALTGTVLVPMLTSKINEMFGIDLSHLPNQMLGPGDVTPQPLPKGKKKKKSTAKKNGKRKGAKREADVSANG